MQVSFVIQEIIINGVIKQIFYVVFIIVIMSLAFNYLHDNIIK